MTKLTAEELKGYTKEDMIALVMQMQEALAVSNAKQFGRKSETMECLGQVSLFNETEMYADASVPEATAKKAHGKKKAGKQKENVSRLPLRVQNHELPEEELVSVFGENGWKRLPDKVYLKVEYLPARQECVEHHIALYAGIINTCAGSIIVTSIAANKMPLHLKLQREKPYATIAEDSSVPIVARITRKKELQKNFPKVKAPIPRHPLA